MLRLLRGVEGLLRLLLLYLLYLLYVVGCIILNSRLLLSAKGKGLSLQGVGAWEPVGPFPCARTVAA